MIVGRREPTNQDHSSAAGGTSIAISPRMRVVCSVSSIALLVGSCGGEGHTPWPVNECAARRSAAQLSRLATAMTAMDGPSGLMAVDGLFDNQQLIFDNQAPPSCVADGHVPMGASVSAECTSTSCTFMWNLSQQPFVQSFHATAERDGDAMTVAIEHDIYHSRQSGGTSRRSDGSLRVTEDSVDGVLRLHEEQPGLDLPPRWTSDTVLDYRSIRLDAQGCPIGGSLHAVVVAESLDGGPGFSGDLEGVISFGPACGEFTLDPATPPP